MPGDYVDPAMKRVSDWLDNNSSTPSSREPLSVIENHQSRIVNADIQGGESLKKRKRAPEPARTMSQTPSPKKRLLDVGLGESPLARGKSFSFVRYMVD